MQAGGYSTLERHQHAHAVMILRGSGRVLVGVGLGWGSMMGNPYVMLAGSIPPQRTGVYMGIFNMFIVIPMLIQGVTLPLIYKSWLDSDPRQVLVFAGILMLLAALATLRVKLPEGPSAVAPSGSSAH